MGTPTAPHPVLKKYYESEDARQGFVTALFDATARHYDWVCGVGSLGSGQFYRRWVLRHYGFGGGIGSSTSRRAPASSPARLCVFLVSTGP